MRHESGSIAISMKSECATTVLHHFLAAGLLSWKVFFDIGETQIRDIKKKHKIQMRYHYFVLHLFYFQIDSRSEKYRGDTGAQTKGLTIGTLFTCATTALHPRLRIFCMQNISCVKINTLCAKLYTFLLGFFNASNHCNMWFRKLCDKNHIKSKISVFSTDVTDGLRRFNP